MSRGFYSLFLICMFVFSGSISASDHNGAKKEEKFNAVKMINDHISDTNEWHLVTLNEGTAEERHISIPLPVIIKDLEGFHIFMSSEAAHGHEHDGYTLEHGVIKSTKNLKRAELPDLFKSGTNVYYDFSITKNVATLFISVALLLFIFVSIARSYQKSPVPSGFGKFLEPIIIMIRDDIAIANIGSEKYKKFMPYLLTVFFFIWFNNLLGLIPVFPGGANFTGNIAVTMVLALFTTLIIFFNANKYYWKHIFTPPVPILMYPIMVPLEIVGIFTKPFALTMRLFANITAGHIMILSIFSLIFIFKNAFLGFISVPLALFVSMLELLVAVLQAYIFTVLSALFIGMAVEDHAHDH